MQAAVAGAILRPEDMKMLARVLAQCEPAATSVERDKRAAELIHHFGAGVKDESLLVKLMIGSGHQAA
ncbi:hypothetical protein [Aminobacter sp. HY435]|uniref:hypothetical protein n=1 Tax=Aminobacter sp. HY435 TaxID=2970917 RepID=UPI0022B97FB5|nr:hypothetical protein [Aminobacter sp. HY435]